MTPFDTKATPAWIAALRPAKCKCGTCQRSHSLRQVSDRKAGIRMGNAWYCSSACFTAAAVADLSELMKAGWVQGSHTTRMPLGLILMSRGLLTDVQLREVTSEHKELGGEIGDLLVRRGSVSERQVAAVRATQWGCPLFAMPKHLNRTHIRVPLTLIQLYSAVPVHLDGGGKLLLVGFIHGIEYGLLYAIEHITRCKTQPCFVTPSDFEVQMHRLVEFERKHNDATPNEVNFESVHTAQEIAGILCSYGVDLEADEVIIARCKEHLWARLICDVRKVDLLFKTG